MKRATTLFAVILTVFAMSVTAYAKKTEDLKLAEIKTSAFTFEQKLKIESHIYEFDGIKEALYNTQTKKLTVKFDANQVTTDMMIYSIVNNLGYNAELISEKKFSPDNAKKEDKKEKKQANVKIDKNTQNQMNESIDREYNDQKNKFMDNILSLNYPNMNISYINNIADAEYNNYKNDYIKKALNLI